MTAEEERADRDAATLRAAVEVMRRRFGGLATTIAVLEEKAAALDQIARVARHM